MGICACVSVSYLGLYYRVEFDKCLSELSRLRGNDQYESEHTLSIYHPPLLFDNATIQTFLSLKPPAWKYLADENTTADAKIENPQNNFKPR